MYGSFQNLPFTNYDRYELDLGMSQFQHSHKEKGKKIPNGFTKGIWGIHASTRDWDTHWYSLHAKI